MKTQTALFVLKASLLGLSLSLAGCSGSESGATANGTAPMYVVSCSLGCGSAAGGTPVSCSLVNVAQNAEVSITFSQPVDLTTVTAASFRLVNLDDGTVPQGVFTTAPGNSRTLVFRPSLTFSGSGVPEFGFDPQQTYQLQILGTNQGNAGPFIRSVGGQANTTLMECTLRTTEPLIDPVPGNPVVTAYLTSTLDPVTGLVTYDPVTYLPVGGTLLSGQTDVPLESRIVLIFNDIMNKSTVADQLSGTSSNMTITREAAGGGATFQAGRWDVVVDFENLLRTTAVYTPTTGTLDPESGLADTSFLSSGVDPMNPKNHRLLVTNALTDVVGNPLANPGVLTFTMLSVNFSEQVITEDFKGNLNEDINASGSSWGSGKLAHGSGGGSGRLGALLVKGNETLELNTVSQAFPIPSSDDFDGQVQEIMSNVDPDSYTPGDEMTWPTVTVSAVGEAFEFSEVEIKSGGMVMLTGARPGRLFARGNMVIAGVLDLSGETPEPHLSNSGRSNPIATPDAPNSYPGSGFATALGGDGGVGGPNAGAGGRGADRLDVTGISTLEFVGGVAWDNDPDLALLTAVADGEPGVGVGGVVDGGTDAATGGLGGIHFPETFPASFSSTSPDFGDLEVDSMGTGLDQGTPPIPERCRVAQVAGAGSGGSHALGGTSGVSRSFDYGLPDFPVNPNAVNTAPETPGGENLSLALEAPGSAPNATNKRNLEFWRKNLNGGSGGGGGGTSILASQNNSGNHASMCAAPNWGLFPIFDHSAAGGGGGGGALMLVAGRELVLRGTINCSGGDGGSATQAGVLPIECDKAGTSASTADPDCGFYAAPGGGGAGGSLRMQANSFTLTGSAAGINVAGGTGGNGAGGSTGGDGGPGLIRIETNSFTDQATEAAIYAPFITPFVSNASDPFNVPFQSAAILSVGDWTPAAGNGFTEHQAFRPESYSGAQSCWMTGEAAAGAAAIRFVEDAASNPDMDPALYGWNMDIVFDTLSDGQHIFPYRGVPQADSTDAYDEDVFLSDVVPFLGAGVDFETYFGTTLNHGESVPSDGSYVVVRFQGVNANLGATSPCDLDLAGPAVSAGSLTPFVSHPQFLNTFPQPANLFRFAVVFDESLRALYPNVEDRVIGISNLRIRIQPE